MRDTHDLSASGLDAIRKTLGAFRPGDRDERLRAEKVCDMADEIETLRAQLAAAQAQVATLTKAAKEARACVLAYDGDPDKGHYALEDAAGLLGDALADIEGRDK